VSHRSIRRHAPVTASSSQRGLPRRVSSIPSTSVGSGSASAAAAASMTALCAVGQDTPNAPATSLTARFASPTAAPIARRIRPVTLARGGTSPIDSVNDPRGHSTARQRHRRLRHTTTIAASPYGRSRGRVATHCFGEVEISPHSGQPAAHGSAVNMCTSRTPSTRSTTRSTVTPRKPSSNVIPLLKLVASSLTA